MGGGSTEALQEALLRLVVLSFEAEATWHVKMHKNSPQSQQATGLRLCISNKLPGEVGATGPGNHVLKSLFP